jgi:hypothetical protein
MRGYFSSASALLAPSPLIFLLSILCACIHFISVALAIMKKNALSVLLNTDLFLKQKEAWSRILKIKIDFFSR